MTEADRDAVFRRAALPPGLHFVATPIGNARDVTLRALDTLASADVLAAEDTRSARRLMEIHGVPRAGRPLLAYHDRNGAAMRPRLLGHLGAGRTVACLAEAGTPLVSDPGFPLARAAIEAGHPVHAVPGPSAPLAALAVSGLAPDRVLFAGFPPTAAGPRRRALAELAALPATLVLFEAPGRTAATLATLAEVAGPERPAALCRELTKRFEEVRRGPLGDLAAGAAESPPRGEVVLVVDRPPAAPAPDQARIEAALGAALADRPVKAAAAEIAARFGLPRREAYRMALRIRGALDEN